MSARLGMQNVFSGCVTPGKRDVLSEQVVLNWQSEHEHVPFCEDIAMATVNEWLKLALPELKGGVAGSGRKRDRAALEAVVCGRVGPVGSGTAGSWCASAA